ncbi:M20/M25/M40 family metallo-hydrolase [uncultured Senegalimassilia sp.]|uniref:M20/M25/M40 family metallo-hydrolase n=1 Tax=uncultured Senegalimassilia sp. TaxID=1714350 RepID=UPI0025E44147|nr:M20/M25/M40 family metallo-hydrolase [uncultured Senegalimassilia sp.]
MSCGDEAAEALAGLDAWIAGHEDELVDVVSRLVRVPSVGEPFDPKAAQPFGSGCAAVIDATRCLAEGYGLTWENHAYYAMSARLPHAVVSVAGGARPAAPSQGDTARPAGDARGADPQAAGTVPGPAAKAGDIAFFSHLDVVPTGSQGWSADPFSPYIRDGWLFGRGSSDNKGPFSAVLFALRYLRERNVPLRHDVVLYGGCDEERGMDDIKYLVPRIPKPAASLVSDAYFPVCYSEKGMASFDLARRFDDGSLIAFEGGASHNTVPDRAAFAVRGESGLVRETVEGHAAHAAFPQQGVNAVALAAARAAQVEGASPQVREAMGFIARAFAGYDGSELGVARRDAELGDTTCVATGASFADGVLNVHVNMRYPASETGRELLACAASAAGAAGFSLHVADRSEGYVIDASSPQVEALTGIVNDRLGTQLEPYAMGGATHARWIPGAIGFGPGRNDASGPFPGQPGRGAAHGPDEAVSIQRLKDAVAIYVQAILYLDTTL